MLKTIKGVILCGNAIVIIIIIIIVSFFQDVAYTS